MNAAHYIRHVCVSAAATWLPAIRAAAVDPARLLR